MYRINLYPRGREKRAERAGRVRRVAIMALVSGTAVAFVGLFIVSALAVKEQANSAERTAASLRNQMTSAQKTESRVVVNQIRELVEKRSQRLDWSPALTEIARLLPGNLILESIEAYTTPSGGDRFQGLTLFGRLTAGRNMEPVIRFAGMLSQSDVYRQQFNEAKVDRVDTRGEVARFPILCPRIQPEPPPVPEETGG
jgi:Tfp pilus assembly protein PilN